MESAVENLSNENTQSNLPENGINEKTPTPPLQELPKKSKKEDKLKKEDKNVEQFMKSLNSVPSLEEKLSLVCKKYVQTADENRKLQFYIKQSDKRYTLLLKEKEQLQHEFNKTVLVKSKLENLCRELQKQNKAIKEESLLKIREEEERRKETQAKFQSTLSEITTLLQQNNEKNTKLRDDNISMNEKFKSVVQQYQLREQQVDKMAKQMALESQLSDAKLQKAGLEHKAEKERILAELEQMKMAVGQYRAKILELQGTETALRGQLAVYTDKYDEFQNALVKSNQVFGGFKEQMEAMSKKTVLLEKECLSWKARWERSQAALLQLCAERPQHERQLQQLHQLCRTLQADRNALLAALKEHGVERPPLPTPEPPPANNEKVDAMAANCVQLRQSLAHLQSQLNVLTNKKEEPTKTEKRKKSKSKKNKHEKQLRDVDREKNDLKDSNNKLLKDQSKCTSEEIEGKIEIDVKESSKDQGQDKSNDNLNENDIFEGIDDKVDDKTLESLIEAISSANISLCDLDIINDIDDDNTTNNDLNKDEVLEENIDKVVSEENIKDDLNKETIETVPEGMDDNVIANLKKGTDSESAVIKDTNNINETINAEEVTDIKEIALNTPVDTINVQNKNAEIMIDKESAVNIPETTNVKEMSFNIQDTMEAKETNNVSDITVLKDTKDVMPMADVKGLSLKQPESMNVAKTETEVTRATN